MFSLLEQCASEVDLGRDRGNITTLPWHHIGANIPQEFIQVSIQTWMKCLTMFGCFYYRQITVRESFAVVAAFCDCFSFWQNRNSGFAHAYLFGRWCHATGPSLLPPATGRWWPWLCSTPSSGSSGSSATAPSSTSGTGGTADQENGLKWTKIKHLMPLQLLDKYTFSYL